jgi:hypothetical protein
MTQRPFRCRQEDCEKSQRHANDFEQRREGRDHKHPVKKGRVTRQQQHCPYRDCKAERANYGTNPHGGGRVVPTLSRLRGGDCHARFPAPGRKPKRKNGKRGYDYDRLGRDELEQFEIRHR